MRVLSSRATSAPAASARVAAIALSAGPAVATGTQTVAAPSAGASVAPTAAWALSGPGAMSPANLGGFANTRSTNWPGYAADTGTYTSVSASWVQPAITCGKSSEAVFRVGLDGWGSAAIGSSSAAAITMYSGGLDASISKLTSSENFKVTWKNY